MFFQGHASLPLKWPTIAVAILTFSLAVFLKVGHSNTLGSANYQDLFLTAGSSSDLSVTNIDNTPDAAVVGGTLSYLVTVTNNGPDGATGVTLSDLMHPTVVIQTATSTSGTCTTTNNLITCNIGALVSGAKATITISAKATVAGIINSIATANGNQIDSNGANNSVSQQTKVNGPAGPSVVNATIFNPPGLTNNVGFPFGVGIVESTGLVYIGGTGGFGDEIGVINPDSNTLIKAIPLQTSGSNHFGRVNQTGAIVYFLQSGVNTNLIAIDGRPASPTFNKVLSTLSLAGQNILSFDIDETRNQLYVSSSSTSNSNSSKISIVDANPVSSSFNQVIAEVAFPAGANVGAIAVNASTNKIYSSCSGNAPGVYVLNGSSRVLTQITGTASSPRSIIVNSPANLIYGGTNPLYAIDGNTDTLLTAINLPSPINGTNESMALNKSTGRVFTRGTNTVVAIDGQRGSPTFNTVTGQVTVQDVSGDIAVDEASNRLIVVSQNSLKTTVIDATNNSVVATIASNALPSGMALNSQTHRAFVANQLTYVQKVNVSSAALEANILMGVEAIPGSANTNNHRFYTARTDLGTSIVTFDKDGLMGQVNGLPHNAGRFLLSASNNVTNRVYVENSAANLAADRFFPGFVTVIDGANNNVIANVPVGNQPFGPVAINQTTNKIYVSNAGIPQPGGISIIDGFTNTKVDADISALPANSVFSGPLVVNETANKVYFTVSQRLDVLNGVTNVASVLTPTGVSDIRVDNTLNRVYALVSNASGVQVVAVDGASNAVITTTTVEPNASGSIAMAVNQITGKVFVSDTGNNTITVINGSTMAIDGTVTTVGGARILGISEVANRVYVSSNFNTLSILDANNNLSLVASLALPFPAQVIGVDPKIGRVFAGCFGTSDQAGVAIVADTTHSISGVIRDVSGNPLNGVNVSLSGGLSLSTTTNTAGAFSFANLPEGGTYSVTPTNSNFSFSPTTQPFNNLSTDRIANFVGTQTLVNISGKVTDANGAALSNVSLALTKNGVAAGVTQSNATGDYGFNNLAAAANYVVTPAGSFAPSSQSFNNLTVNTNANFKGAPSIAPQCDTASFAPTTFFPAGSGPQSIAIADFNGDGKPDLAVANNSFPYSVGILLGTGTGTFGGVTNFSVGSNGFPQPVSVVSGDFNGDGKADLVVANFGSNNVSVLLGTGPGTFSAATSFAAGTNPLSVVLGDFNGDGKLDIAVANANSANVSILLGTGSGAFGSATNFSVGSGPSSIVVGDFNGDGKQDLATANQGSGNVSILLGNGAGGFGIATNFNVGSSASPRPVSIAVGDFNGDGKLDLAVANFDSSSSNVSVLLGVGNGSFSAATNFVAGTNPVSLSVGDFNGDGKSDLAVANGLISSANVVSILLGTGTGSFSAPNNFSIDGSASSLGLADFNGDGKTDLAVARNSAGDVSILINNRTFCSAQSGLSISGQARDVSNKGLANVTVALSGPVSRTAQTDAVGNYSFTNLTPGGDYTVTVQSPYFVFAPTGAGFFNLSSSQTFNFTAAQVAAPATPPPPSDTFDGAARDATKWNLGTQTEPPSAFDPRVTTSQVNGSLVIKPQAQAVGMHYNGYVATNAFDMTGGNVKVEMIKAATGGADSIFAIGSDTDNFFRFMVHSAGVGTNLAQTVKDANGFEQPLDTTTNQLVIQVKINGVLSSISIPYDAVAQRFMRFRHEAATASLPFGAIRFETSPDNSNFTLQQRVVLTAALNPVLTELSAGTSNPTNPSEANFGEITYGTSGFQFSAGAYTVGENEGSALITVNRVGDTTNPASVEYTTIDGTAREGKKYTAAVGRLDFAAGQTSKTFFVLIIDNAIAEGNQNVILTLRNPVGGGLVGRGLSVLTIVDDDTLNGPNQVDNSQFFVRQHYLDFLNRAPDASGLQFWTNNIDNCTPKPSCTDVKRIDTSAAYFLSIEFQQTGYLVERLYKAAYASGSGASTLGGAHQIAVPIVRFSEFLPDTQQIGQGVIVGQTGYETVLENNKVAFTNDFVQRPRFTSAFATTITPAQFVDRLFSNAGVNPSTTDRNAAIAEFGSATNTTDVAARARALRRVGENATLNTQEFNRAFVLMQFFGYLRRDPNSGQDTDYTGYDFWLTKLNQFNGNYNAAEMVKAFITSTEYRQRFGL